MARKKESETGINVDERCSDNVTRAYLKFQYHCVADEFYT
jgi:hypothetical protein